MKQFSSQFKKQSESIRMRASERSELKAKLVSYMEYHPLPKEMREEVLATKAIKGGITSEPFFIFNINTTYLRNFSGAFAVFCLFVVPILAENSLPGDALYPMKVQFNEEVRSSLSFTPYAKVAWETERLERRISEARLLVAEGKMTPEIQAQFTEAIKTHADSAQRELAILKESDADKAVIAEIAFASALEVQSEVLEGDMDGGPTGGGVDGTAILAVAHVVEEARSSIVTAQAEAPVSYENLLAAVETESTQMYELFESVKGDASAEEIVDIERRLEDVKRKIADARVQQTGETPAADEEMVSVAVALMHSEGADTAPVDALMATKASAEPETADVATADVALMSTADATVLAKEAAPVVDPEVAKQESVLLLKGALTDIQKLINYLTNIEVRNSVSIERLVPVTPTAGERAREIKNIYDETKLKAAGINNLEISSRLKNKVRHGKQIVEEKLGETSRAMSRGNLDEAKSAVDEAREFMLDLEKIVANEPTKNTLETVDETAGTPETIPEEVTEAVQEVTQ